jgi:hypothetical protein
MRSSVFVLPTNEKAPLHHLSEIMIHDPSGEGNSPGASKRLDQFCDALDLPRVTVIRAAFTQEQVEQYICRRGPPKPKAGRPKTSKVNLPKLRPSLATCCATWCASATNCISIRMSGRIPRQETLRGRRRYHCHGLSSAIKCSKAGSRSGGGLSRQSCQFQT